MQIHRAGRLSGRDRFSNDLPASLARGLIAEISGVEKLLETRSVRLAPRVASLGIDDTPLTHPRYQSPLPADCAFTDDAEDEASQDELSDTLQRVEPVDTEGRREALLACGAVRNAPEKPERCRRCLRTQHDPQRTLFRKTPLAVRE